jgi:hypothetical protein
MNAQRLTIYDVIINHQTKLTKKQIITKLGVMFF